jgi:hypothetical protein
MLKTTSAVLPLFAALPWVYMPGLRDARRADRSLAEVDNL